MLPLGSLLVVCGAPADAFILHLLQCLHPVSLAKPKMSASFTAFKR